MLLFSKYASRTSTRRILTKCPYSTSSAQDTAIYHSLSHNPWFNLAFEDWIFRNTPASQIVLYVYRNSPCVVIGRNQNPWKEINLPLLRKIGVPFVRRRSGGGTVYHVSLEWGEALLVPHTTPLILSLKDLGNTNYCVCVPRNQFERKTNALLVSDALNNLDINTYVNDRNDICIDGYKISPQYPSRWNFGNNITVYHVSGSAFKIVQARAYHHGTMLIDAKLSALRGVLSNNTEGMVSKGVESVPSPVKNLAEWDSLLDHQSFFEAVADQFIHVYGGSRDSVKEVDEREMEKKQYVKDVFEELQTWDWQWGQTPEFSRALRAEFSWGAMTITIKSRHGLVTDVVFELQSMLAPLRQSACDKLRSALVGQRYEDLQPLYDLCSSTGVHEEAETLRDIHDFLAKSL